MSAETPKVDELITRLREVVDSDFREVCTLAADALTAAQAELAALRKDAERYRWMMNLTSIGHEAWGVIVDGTTSAEQMTTAIDAAITATKG